MITCAYIFSVDEISLIWPTLVKYHPRCPRRNGTCLPQSYGDDRCAIRCFTCSFISTVPRSIGETALFILCRTIVFKLYA